MDIGGGPLMVDQSNWINESLPWQTSSTKLNICKERTVSV